MNLRTVFENRSGRVIALFRAVLALVFLVALLIEPVNASPGFGRGQMLIGAYLVISLAMIPVAWRSWWYDQLLARALLVIDIVVFVAAVYVTESTSADFTSPFLAMFALAILSATLRWDWRVAAWAGVAATALFVIVGLGLWLTGSPLDTYRFSRRALYMMALLLVLVWFGVQRRDPSVPPPDLLGADGSSAEARWRALDYAMALTGARHGALAWSDAEEPWLELHQSDGSGRDSERLGPDTLSGWDDAADAVRLFDLGRRRMLVRNSDGLTEALPLRNAILLAQRCGIARGLTLPIRGVTGTGLIVLGNIPGAGADFLTLGAIITREIGSAFDRSAALQLEREALLSRTRGAIARDLHDSVAQSLAGACFRLEALRRNPASGANDDELRAIRDALRREQGHVRELIDALRMPQQQPEQRDLSADLAMAGHDAAAHWNLAVEMLGRGPIAVPGWLSHEMQQLVREAIANAARHGGAKRVDVRLSRHGNQLRLDIADDGIGFAASEQVEQPWSIRERVAALGGQLTVASGASGTRLEIVLPTGSAGAFA